MKQWRIALIAGFVSLSLLGCETEEDNKISGALQCLDEIKKSGNSSEEKAEKCYDMVEGIDSSDASYIRCVSIYNMRGLFSDEFVEAFQGLENTGSGTNSNLQMMSVIAFLGTDDQTGNPPQEDAEDVLEECSNADSKGHTMLAAATRIGTTLAVLAGSLDTNLLEAELGNITGDKAVEVGEAAQSAWDSYCGGSTGENAFCETLEDAGADDGLSAEALGLALANILGQAN